LLTQEAQFISVRMNHSSNTVAQSIKEVHLIILMLRWRQHGQLMAVIRLDEGSAGLRRCRITTMIGVTLPSVAIT
jgi:hypothetical protein